jgi:hypothetical protein
MNKLTAGTLIKIKKEHYGENYLTVKGLYGKSKITNRFVVCEVIEHQQSNCCGETYCMMSKVKIWVPLLNKVATVYGCWITKLKAKPLYGISV